MNPFILRLLAAVLIISFSAVSSGQVINPPIVDGKFMTVEDGHLSYDGKRMRFWGVNFCASVKRGGKDLELNFDRLMDAGFNGVRFNLSGRVLSDRTGDVTYKVPVTVKGSDSKIDRLDYAIYLARQRGIFFWMQFDRLKPSFTPADYDLLPDDGTREQWNEVINGPDKRWTRPNNLVYVYPRAGKIFMEYAKNVLDHVNPYTGKRYGDEETIAIWEIFNENLFVQDFAFGNAWNTLPEFLKKKVTDRWNNWLLQRYKDDAGLKKAWGELRPGESLADKTVAYAPLYKGAKLVQGPGYQPKYVYTDAETDGVEYPYQRGEDVVRFGVWMYRDFVREFTAFFRTQGKGAAAVPLVPTGCFEMTAAQYLSVMDGDFVTNGTYGFAFRAWKLKKDDPFYPFVPRVNQHPMMGQPSDVMRAAGKPYLLYECNDYRPNPYAIEYPLRIATSLIALDADGVFWFTWDGDIMSIKTDEDIRRYPLPMPYKEYPNYCLTMHNDEMNLAALKAAGVIFRQANLPRPKRVQVVIGKDRLFNFSKPSIDDLVHRIRFSAWRTGVDIVYDPTAETQLPPVPEDWKEESCDLGPYIHFEWKDAKGFIRIDAPTCKAQVGFNPPDLTFGDVKVTGLNRKFSSVNIVAEDGLPLEESKSILVCLAATSENTGVKLDPDKYSGGWASGLAEIVVDPGTTPIIMNRVSATITAPWLKGRKFQKHDFLRNIYATGTVGESFVVSADEPMFYTRITKP